MPQRVRLGLLRFECANPAPTLSIDELGKAKGKRFQGYKEDPFWMINSKDEDPNLKEIAFVVLPPLPLSQPLLSLTSPPPPPFPVP